MDTANSPMTPTAVPAVVREHRPDLTTINVGPPPGVSDEDCGTVESLVGQVGGYAAYTSHWKPTVEQLELLNAGGSIELVQYVPRMVMHSMSVWPADEQPPTPAPEVLRG